MTISILTISTYNNDVMAIPSVNTSIVQSKEAISLRIVCSTLGLRWMNPTCSNPSYVI